MYTHQSINDRGVITNEQLLEILIEDHTGKKTSPKDSNSSLTFGRYWFYLSKNARLFVVSNPPTWIPTTIPSATSFGGAPS